MYLYRKVYVQNWDHHTPEQKWTITATRGDGTTLDTTGVCYLQYQVAYWRKANAIHNWFVKECGNGIDECQPIYVSEEKLRELLDICKEVKRLAHLEAVPNGREVAELSMVDASFTYSKAKQITNAAEIAQILPSASGFFFGSTEYDQYYLEDIDLTIKQLEKALENSDDDFTYQASW